MAVYVKLTHDWCPGMLDAELLKVRACMSSYANRAVQIIAFKHCSVSACRGECRGPAQAKPIESQPHQQRGTLCM